MSDERDMSALVAQLGDHNRPLKLSELASLNDLDDDESEILLQEWPDIELFHRRALAQSLQEMAEDTVEVDFRAVFLVLLNDEDAQIRAAAVRGLLEDTRRSTLSRLLDVLSTDSDSFVQAAAATTLGAWALQAAQGDLPDRVGAEIAQCLVQVYQAPQTAVEVRRRLLETLGFFGELPEVESLIEEASRYPDELWQQSTLCAMGRTGMERWLKPISAALTSRVPALRYEAARAVGEMGELAEDLVPALARASVDSDVEVSTAAIWALGQIGNEQARRALRHVAYDGTGARRDAAAEALSELDFFDDPMHNFPFAEDDEDEDEYFDEEE